MDKHETWGTRRLAAVMLYDSRLSKECQGATLNRRRSICLRLMPRGPSRPWSSVRRSWSDWSSKLGAVLSLVHQFTDVPSSCLVELLLRNRTIILFTRLSEWVRKLLLCRKNHEITKCNIVISYKIYGCNIIGNYKCIIIISYEIVNW